MIHVFISDIDGCLSEPYQPFSLSHLHTLGGYARAAGPVQPGYRRGALPAFTLCSGRPYPYVEAMSQALGLSVPVLFESGGGMFDPQQARIFWNPNFTAEHAEALEALRVWITEEAIAGTSINYDFGKRTQLGVIGPDPDEVASLVPVVEAYVAEHFPEMNVYHTPVSIDVLPPGINKRVGVAWLADHLGLSLDEVAYIGDTNGDLLALQAVGYSFAPSNATSAVKAIVDQVSTGAVIEGVLRAYRWCIAENERIAA